MSSSSRHASAPRARRAAEIRRLDAGYPCAQVYAPAGQDVICFEPMTAPTNALVSGDGLTWAAPGSSYTATFSISLS